MVLQAFARPTGPNRAALLTAVQLVVPDVVACGVTAAPIGDGVSIVLSKTAAWQPADVTAAQAAVVAAPDATPESEAQYQVDTWPIQYKALVLALIDQLNIIRAALPTPLGAITPSQAIAAVRAKAGTL